MTIAEFLEARIAEDEELARDAIANYVPDPWDNPASAGNYYPADVAFWNQQTPARVLTECAAKRALTQLHDLSVDPCDEFDASFKSVPCETLLTIAAVYKDHPAYRQEWALAHS